jgi:Asp-tRNA(Asn)/Glu-tRNA(Gln) amidotransferase A subunit family amidase
MSPRANRPTLLRAVVLAVAAAFGAQHHAGSVTAPDDRAQQPAGSIAFEPAERSIRELQDAMRTGVTTSRQLVAAYLARIEAYDRQGPALNAMIALNARALETAASLDAERRAGRLRGPLHGIPLVVKDNFDTADMPTTGGSIGLAGFVPPADAFQVRRLREAGVVILGKTNLHELAAGITTVSSLGGQTRNPYDPARNPGGSSGGTGAAVAASFAAAGLGTDTCGSIRIPASHNNLFGLRPTQGLSSRSGIIPLSHTQDVAGPLARSTIDLAILLDATAGVDPADPVTALGERRRPASYADALRGGRLDGLRLGVLASMFGDGADDREAGQIVRRAIERMKMLGAEPVEVEIAGLDAALNGSSVIDSEFKFDLMDYLAKTGNPPIRSLADVLERGLYHEALESSFRRRNAVPDRETDQYRRARIKRDLVRHLTLAALDEHRLTAIVYPTMTRKPAAIGEPQRGSTCQLSASTGLPALSAPAGLTDDGMPIGMELLGGPFAEAELLRIADAYERAVKPRRAPTTTPALVEGRAPSPAKYVAAPGTTAVSVSGRFAFDSTRGILDYEVAAAGIDAGAVHAVALHRTIDGQTGPVVARLIEGGRNAGSGRVALTAAVRQDLQSGRLALVAHRPAGPPVASVLVPDR